MLVEAAERALAHTDKRELLLIGGVAANKRLCELLENMCNERGAKFFAVPMQYAGDQGAMIAWQGILEHKGGAKKPLDILPYERTDEVVIGWYSSSMKPAFSKILSNWQRIDVHAS